MVPVPANQSALRWAIDELPLDAAFPESEARIDDLSTLVSELSEVVGMLNVGRGGDQGAGDIAEMLSALKGARW